VQWQLSSNGGAFASIPGATSTTLTLTGTTASQNGSQYEAVFTNTAGSATTTAATLTVNFAPTVTQQPTNQTVNAGQPASFTASANGNPAPTVQWQLSSNGGAFASIPGATSTTLTLTGTTTSQNGNQYQAIFTNSIGSGTTTAATLTVNSPAGVGGAAFDGPVVGATIDAYSVSSVGVVGTTAIASTVTDPNGNYSLTLPSGFSGPLLITSLGGTYVDDATGQTEQAGPLSVLVPDASGTVTAELTPLTSMVAQLALQLAAAAGSSPESIATTLYTDLGTEFGGLSNIMSTPLVDVATPNCATGASQASVDMSLAVAALSQLGSEYGVTSASLTAALIQDYASDGIFDGAANSAPIAVPLSNGSGSVNLCTIEGDCTGSTSQLPQTIATAITAFQSSTANVCGATVSQTTLANLNNPTLLVANPPAGVVPVSVSGGITGLNPNQVARLRVGTLGLPNHCATTTAPACPGVVFSITGNGSFSGAGGTAFSGFTGTVLSVTVSDEGHEACAITAPSSKYSNVTPNTPVSINGIQISCGTVTYPVSVWVSGLTSGQSVQFQNSGVDTLTVSNNGIISFSTQLSWGSAYDVTISTQPSSETCTVQGTGMGTIDPNALVFVDCGTSGATGVLSNPNGLLLSNDQTLLYLANAGGNQVLIYNITRSATTGAVTALNLNASITADIVNPTRLALDATGEFLYVTNFGPSGSNGWVSVYDTLNGNAELTADKISAGISRPLGVAVDKSGDVYVAENSADAISVFQPQSGGGFAQASFSPIAADGAGNQFFAPGALAFYSLVNLGDYIVVGTGNGNELVYAAPLTNTSTPLFALSDSTCIGAPAGPTGFALSAGIFGGLAPSFFISNYYGGDVLDYGFASFASGGACPAPLTQTPSNSNNGPEGVAIDADGNVFVTNAGGNSLVVYPAAALGAPPTLTVH
jgi:sugar lactone lactonase YvrE